MSASCEFDVTGSPGPMAQIHGCAEDAVSMGFLEYFVQFRHLMSAVRVPPSFEVLTTLYPSSPKASGVPWPL